MSGWLSTCIEQNTSAFSNCVRLGSEAHNKPPIQHCKRALMAFVHGAFYANVLRTSCICMSDTLVLPDIWYDLTIRASLGSVCESARKS